MAISYPGIKRINILLLVALLIGGPGYGQKKQQKIKYGSNNGKHITILNTKIYYEEYGKGVPLVLLHGGVGNIADFALCIPELSKHFRVIAADAPGLAKSGMIDSISYEILADFASGMIDQLKLDSAYVMGWSDGGNTALILAAKRPDKIKKVLTSGANYKLSGYNFGDTNSLKLIPADYKLPPDQDSWVTEHFGDKKAHWIKIMNDRIKMWAKEIYFPGTVLDQIKIPVLLVIGDRDGVLPEHAIEMHRMIKGSQLCILPNTSHAVFEEKPALINTIAISFFTR